MPRTLIPIDSGARMIHSDLKGSLLIMKLENIAQTLTPLPLSSHGKPVDSFSQATELENELKRVVKGEVRFDRGSRALYAADGSNYRPVPIGLVVPRDDGGGVWAGSGC